MRAVARRLVVIGAGTAGTMIVNRLRRRLPRQDWTITVVDRDDVHPYQPGYLFLPFGVYEADQLSRPRHEQLAAEHLMHIRWWTQDELSRFEPSPSEFFAPRRLPQLVAELLRDGPPRDPIDTGV